MIKSINKTSIIAEPVPEPQLVIFFPPFYCFHDILLQNLKYVLEYCTKINYLLLFICIGGKT